MGPDVRSTREGGKVNIGPLDAADRGYALFSWRESHKQAPSVHRMPWSYYKDTLGHAFQQILDDKHTVTLGIYTDARELVGWLAMTPGKRVHTVHWVHVKYELDGVRMRRRGAMLALLAAADLGKNFVYTLHARRDRATLPDGSVTKSLDESLVYALRGKGVTATYVPLKEWLK